MPKNIINTILTIGRYILGGLLCYSGSIALFEGVAYYEGFKGNGFAARVIGAISIAAGIYFVFNRNSKNGSNNTDPPDFG